MNVYVNPHNVRSYPKSRKIRAERKEKRNLGQAYTTQSGKQVPERKFQVLKNCRKKCSLKVSTEHISLLFKKYWFMCDKNRRATYISGLIEFKPKDAQKKVYCA